MENTSTDTPDPPILSISANMAHQGGQIFGYVTQALRDLAEALIVGVEPGPHCAVIVLDGLTRARGPATAQDGVKVLRVPSERHRQRFQSSGTPAAFDRVALDLADDGWRDLGTLYEFALLPTEFIHALVDGLGNRRPVFRHPFLRAPPTCRD